jgi:FhuF 2Fe-2S C-terminal domain
VSVAEPETVREALAAAAQAGAFFRLEPGEAVPGQGWLPVAELKAGGLANLVTRTTAQLGTTETRVAASIVHLGLAARLWSPVLGCGLLRGVVPDLRTLVVSPGPPAQLGLAEVAGWAAASPGQIAALSADVVSAQLTALAAALPVALPAGLLRGNSASAMAGALGVLIRHDLRLAGPAAELARALLRTDVLRGTGTLANAGGLNFRRRSCCLYYRVPGAGLCGDCCLTHAPRRQRTPGT